MKGAWKRKPRMQMRAPHNNDKKKLVDANLRALSTSCAPSLRLILLPAAMSEHEAEGIDNSHQGEHDSCSTADTGSKLAYKEGICHIVYTGHKHTDCSWQSKLQHQFVDGGFCHFIILYLRTICFHNMYTFIYKCGK